MKKAAMPGMNSRMSKTPMTKPTAPGKMPGPPLNSKQAMPPNNAQPAAGKPSGRAAALAVTPMPMMGTGGSVVAGTPASGVKAKRTKGM